jgi:uncharacterized protein (UPF0303 family)
MAAAEDIKTIAEQERLLRFSAFDADTAWALGSLLREKLLATGVGGSVEIEIAGHVLFTCTTTGATPGQADWIRRKRNTVRRFAKSSYAVGRVLEHTGEDFEKRNALSLADYAAHGGGFPIYLHGVGCIGSVVLSGLPQREDHGVVVAALAQFLNVRVPQMDSL